MCADWEGTSEEKCCCFWSVSCCLCCKIGQWLILLQGSKSTHTLLTLCRFFVENNRRGCFGVHLTGKPALDLTHKFDTGSVPGSVCGTGICDINTTSLQQLFSGIAFTFSIAAAWVQKGLVCCLSSPWQKMCLIIVKVHFQKKSLQKRWRCISKIPLNWGWAACSSSFHISNWWMPLGVRLPG